MARIVNIQNIIDAGGSVEGDQGSKGTQNLTIYKTDSGKNTIYTSKDDVPKIDAGITMNSETGKITVTVPEKWQDDETVKSYTDNYVLKSISGAYKSNKDTKYQDPFDETKQITAPELVQKMNEALQYQVKVLNAIAPTQSSIIAKWGGTSAKNEVANNIGASDVIIMNMAFNDDDSWAPIPSYMLELYPQLSNLETFKNGFVQKKDFIENFYNIESGKITEEEAYAIAKSPEAKLSEIENMTPEEVSKTVAFGNFLYEVDPKRSNWEQFLQAGDALSKGFYGGLYDWFIETTDLIANVGNLSFIKGETIDTRPFWNGVIASIASTGGVPSRGDQYWHNGEYFDATEYMSDEMIRMGYTNRDAFTKAQAGYAQGRLAGKAVDTVVSIVAVSEVTKAITNRMIMKGASKLASDAATATGKASSSTSLVTGAQATAESVGDLGSAYSATAKAAAKGTAFKNFFNTTVTQAAIMYSKSTGIMASQFLSYTPLQLANIVNSATKIATTITWANTAVNVLGSMVIAAVVSNKTLTTRVLSNQATSDEAKTWIQQVIWDTAKMQGLSTLGNLGAEALNKAIPESAKQAINTFKVKASQKVVNVTSKISHPWLTFMKWFLNNKAAASKVSNAKAAATEAMREAVLANEMRTYGANLSTEPGSYGTKIIQEALAEAGFPQTENMSEALQNLARAGVVFDPSTLDMSEYEVWQADYVRGRNAITNWLDVSSNISQVVKEFTNPDIQPVISQQMTELNKANARLLDEEKKSGLLSADEIKSNKNIYKDKEEFIFSMHSFELSRYIIRGYELKVVTNEAKADGVTDLENYEPYKEAKKRYDDASNAINEKLRDIADKEYVPALAMAEHNIIDIMMNDGVYPRAVVEGMRASGKFGVDGKDWLRLVAKRDVPKGEYNPYSKMVKQDNTISLNRFKILDDDQITWPGNGLSELISEYGIARSEKKLLDSAKKAAGMTTDIAISEAKTAGAAKMKEFRTKLNSAIKQGFSSFVEDVKGTKAIGKKRAIEQREFFEEISVTGGIGTMDIDALRSVMKDKGVTTSDAIVDQPTLDKFYEESSPQGKKIIDSTLGEKNVQETKENVEKFLRKQIDDLFPSKRYSDLEKTIRNKLEKSTKYRDLATDVKNRVKNGKIKKEEEITEFAKLLLNNSKNTKDSLRAGEFLAYHDIKNNNLVNTEYIEYITRKRLKKSVANYNRHVSGASDESIEQYVRGEQYKKLQELKTKDPAKYEDFLSKLDRANASISQKVRESDEVKVAAEEYSNNMKDFENSTIFKEKFSYLAEPKEPKGTLKEFADKNHLSSPSDKRALKAKVKSALWKKFANGEKLPDIKGFKKSDFKDMQTDLKLFYKDIQTDSELLSKEGRKSISDENKAIIKEYKKKFYEALDNTDLFKNAYGANALKYDIDSEKLYNDIDDAIDGMMELIRSDIGANLAINGIMQYQGVGDSEVRFEFIVLSEVLSKYGKDLFKAQIKSLSKKVVSGMIPKNQVVIKGNLDSLYKKIEDAIWDKLENRFAKAKTQLESMGERADSETITELLDEYRSDILGAEADPVTIKTMGPNGEIQYERVSPTLADIWNQRPVYSPMSTPKQILADLALVKKINTTDLSLRSLSKQASSDPAMAFATTGALPGTLQAMRSEIETQFGTAVLNAMEKNDPVRYKNIELIAQREGISMEKALVKNMAAIESVQVPFTLLNQEMLRQANVAKYGNQAAMEMRRKNIWEKTNSGLRKVSDKLGFLQNKRETYVRLYAGEKAYIDALRKGYNPSQAEDFREHAINTATTNFRTKHTVFNFLRSTVPYLTSGISGAKSFWQMFELDPVGVSSRIFTGFILPILYFTGEIMSDEELKKKYKALADYQRENHLVIAVGKDLISIPVGEEMGQYVNLARHIVETLHEENEYDFWSLMINDLVGFLPVDFTGFTDPEMWNSISGNPPSFLEVMENGISKMLASTMPPVAQSVYMANTGRDLYTGKRIDTGYVTIDEDGKPTIMTYSESQFAKALANIVGGDARVIEKVTSGAFGTTAINVLDTITSAVQYVISGGKGGSLTTGVEKALEDIAKPYSTEGYGGLEKRFNAAVNGLFDEKEKITKSDEYIKYNQEISKEKDPTRRQKIINNRNELLTNFNNKVEALVKGYRDAGGSLDKWKFSKVMSLLTFEDAVRADRQFMEINTSYNDAYTQAMQTLYEMGITNPEGPSSLGYIYTDSNGNPQVKMWTPTQIQIINKEFYAQGNIYKAHIEAIINDGTENSLKKQRQLEGEAEQQYWDKYNSTGKLSDAEWDAIDDLRKEYNAKVVLALQDYMNTYGAANVLSNNEVMDYLVNSVIKVPSSEEKVNGRYVSSGGGVLNKQQGFGPYYIKKIFGVVK